MFSRGGTRLPVANRSRKSCLSHVKATSCLRRHNRFLPQQHPHSIRRTFATNNNVSSDWRQLVPKHAYLNPWDDHWLGPPVVDQQQPTLTTTSSTDTETRFILQLLQQMYHTGRSSDRLTTTRCNQVLLQMLEQQPMEGQRVHRAVTMLQTMELLYELPGTTAGPPAAAASTAARLPFPVPLPNRDTYKNVLLILAESQGEGVPQQAQQIVERMDVRYREAGDVALKPLAFHWNCVLSAWMNSVAWDKAIPAAKLFMEKTQVRLVDESSYITMIRICAHNHGNDKAEELGANVAVKIWQETIERDDIIVPDLKSHFYAMFLQAIRRLPASALRDNYFDDCFDRAKLHGKVNKIIVNELLVHNTSVKVYNKHISMYSDSNIKKLHPSEAAAALLERFPKSWKDRADSSPSVKCQPSE